MVSWDYPKGTITNSNLELAGTLTSHDVVAHLFDVRERTTATVTDNTPTMWWQTKGSASTTGPAAYLLHLQALHQCYHRYFPLHECIPGLANVMADVCS